MRQASAATAARGERDRNGECARVSASPGRGVASCDSANSPRAAVAARYVVALPVPGVFASLGTPGYPPLAAFAAGGLVWATPPDSHRSLGQATLRRLPPSIGPASRRGA